MKQKLTLTLLAAILLLSGQQAYAEVYSGVDGNISWSLDTETGVLALSGNGPVKNNNILSAPWGRYTTYIKSVTIPEGVTSIGPNAFWGCSNLTSVTIPEGVKNIGESAFYGCSSLTSVTIPDGVTSIGDGAFSGCSSLTSLTIPNSVALIGLSAFAGTPWRDTWYNSQEDGLLYLGGCLLGYKGSKPEGTLIIKDGTKGITNFAFSGCTGLTSVTIPEGVTSIGGYAFSGCSSLSNITIPNSVIYMNSYSFDGTAWYNSQEDGLLYLDNWLLGHKGSEPEGTLIIKDGTKGIASYAFSLCTGLTSITIPEGVTSIGEAAFRNCSSLTSVMIPEGVTSIGGAAFYGCTGLTSVTIPDGVTSIGYETFSGCSGLTSVTIPESATSIEYGAFWGCSSLTSVTIPEGVTSIEFNAFNSCSNLTNLTIPSSVTSIGYDAFYYCSNLTNLTIPSSVTSIGNYAFHGCSSLMMESDVPCALGDEPFVASNDGFKITVPYGSGEAYRNAEGWSTYADYIVEMPLEDYLYMEDSKTFHKSQLTIPVLMKNAKPFTAFQCDITLPEGLTLHKTMNEDDEEVFDIAYGSRAKSSHSLMANQLTNGNIRVVGYSSSNADYRDSEGMFFTLTVDVADDASGDLTIKLSNVILTSATDGDTECPDMEAVLTIIPGQPGDVNGDGKLTMGDVVKLVNNILEVSQTGFNADLADVNEDGKVTMGDVVIVLNMILSGEYPTKAPSMRQPMAKDEVEDDTVL